MCKGETYGYESDVWSLGVLLYEMTCLKYPFQGKNMIQLIGKITSGKYDEIPAIYSKHMKNIIKGLLQKD